MKRILTGDRPTGKLHLGHYVGSLANRVKLQHEYETFILLADVQALTDNYETPEKIKENIREVVLDYLSVGLDPKLVTIFIQSQVPAIAELTIFYANLVSVARLARNPTVKTEMKQKGIEETVPLGFFMYPVSQAADITCVNADLVPVGKDQLPMIEQTQEIVDKFNNLYGKTLTRPEALVGGVPTLVGIDGQTKMSKSLNNAIYLADSEEEVKNKVMRMYTDPTRIHPTDIGHIENNPVFLYHDTFNADKSEVQDLKDKYQKGQVADVVVKEKLAHALNQFLTPIREKRNKFAQEKNLVEDIVKNGTQKAKEETELTLQKVKAAMGLTFP